MIVEFDYLFLIALGKSPPLGEITVQCLISFIEIRINNPISTVRFIYSFH